MEGKLEEIQKEQKEKQIAECISTKMSKLTKPNEMICLRIILTISIYE